ncbi:hypothetical protein TRVL_07226 [Trypanosoma vivax]|nr:hypothetical protein TRVL_07226 [Trypanosoma vivax]
MFLCTLLECNNCGAKCDAEQAACSLSLTPFFSFLLKHILPFVVYQLRLAACTFTAPSFCVVACRTFGISLTEHPQASVRARCEKRRASLACVLLLCPISRRHIPRYGKRVVDCV